MHTSHVSTSQKSSRLLEYYCIRLTNNVMGNNNNKKNLGVFCVNMYYYISMYYSGHLCSNYS